MSFFLRLFSFFLPLLPAAEKQGDIAGGKKLSVAVLAVTAGRRIRYDDDFIWKYFRQKADFYARRIVSEVTQLETKRGFHV